MNHFVNLKICDCAPKSRSEMMFHESLRSRLWSVDHKSFDLDQYFGAGLQIFLDSDWSFGARISNHFI